MFARGQSRADAKIFAPSPTIAHEQGLFDPFGAMQKANEDLAFKIATKLHEHYKGHPWTVQTEIEHGVVRITLQGFTQWAYTIHYSTLAADPGLRSVVKAGGEFLERLRLPRSAFSLSDWRTAVRKMPMHFNRHQRPPE